MGLKELNAAVVAIKPRTELEANYDKTLLLLAALKSGSIEPKDFELQPGGWSLVIPPELPANES